MGGFYVFKLSKWYQLLQRITYSKPFKYETNYTIKVQTLGNDAMQP